MERLDAAVSLGGVGGGMDHEHLSQGSLNISDVIEVIKTTDPEFVDSSGRMYGGGGGPVAAATMEDAAKAAAYVRIVEQPAPKALRFRYECEGRSAGSIPGVNSTSENKTFPTIKVEGYKGRAVVVVSCVTKDAPYRPHPHNLVGKEGCKRGVCTVEISPENMTASFSNLGIQCVKKKDIDEALKTREDIRVDPFRTGFAHRSQPTSIDLNAVRLCFQVFLEGSERGKFTYQLPPVVSDPIYDKKAMSDLVICKLSDCTATVAGGKEIILLCEKVAKEDIQVRFFEEQGGQVMWEGFGEFQPTQVHKQVAICLRTPRYRTLEVERPVRAHIQLRRPSDGATSEPLPFELIPLESGRPSFWALHRSLRQGKADYRVFSDILSASASLMTGGSIAVSTVPTNNIRTVPKPANTAQAVQVPTSPVTVGSAVVSEELKIQSEGENKLKEDNNDGEVMEAKPETEQETETSRSLKELLSQVAELDEIYSDTRARLLMPSVGDTDHPPETIADEPMEVTEAELAAVVAATENLPEDDSQTYSSLQMAMKNPVVDLLEADRDRYEDVAAPVVPPLISIAPVPPPHGKRDVPPPVTPDTGSERLPPLPPKRSRKSPPGRPDHPPPPQLQQQVHASAPQSPQTPSSTSPPVSPPPTEQPLPAEPRAVKPTLFQKLFSKKKNRKDSTGGRSREGSAQRQSSPSPSRPEEDVIFIPLTGQPELTEAEHYALYTDVAPHATASEFDEMSFYYSPVEGGRILTQQQSQPPEARPRDIFA